MAKKTIKFEVVTPEKVVLKKQVLQVTVPTEDGEITVLPEHIPLMSILKPGVIEMKLEEGELEVMSVSGGFIEVMRDKIIILADTAERADELDEARIEEARARAEARKKELENVDEVQFANIAVQLEKEMARLKALTRWRRLKK
ncbi:ATP synthase F1 subunit epsilon [Candidatus Falkowbacteria bacterium]|nr:ATP synthase F1 subunit epsilon [Candidatus Falkowbacteria bacterium]NCT54378.1 ATP synthase F1 subunit epsilon [Candidatus Falkowbacteria bacterium]